MDLTTWFWTYDRRWFFDLKVPFLDKIWILPIAVDLSLGVLTVYTLFFQNQSCLTQFGYVNWLEVQLSLQILSVILIGFLIFRIRGIDRQHGQLFDHISKPKASNPKNYKYWIRTKGLLSVLGFGVLTLAFIKFVWVWVGYILYTQHSFDHCDNEFKRTFLSNFIVPLVCLIPIGLTIVMFLLIKIINAIGSWLMPSTFVWISKRI
ncbi:transmembrane protein, putative (macronuclear) [Tetrahymena thermophila SB210]|uniref:Transmembrane protein, putative n=1 Tax=Tetrahymena thermophila (strain SB210) TaxID=312017 RepID=I7MCX9_TETTS|nr:transmembrane protein, putative [Tetrahymena thermophila SB210]EAR85123.2 transmembrane protein, putative [Tetrahymena thermophila SB210]|eukprot:XP_001032786.2 transmembrane protein, putative [Tetrahymena thermophila SB210]